jgi:hypothetical protein
MPRQNPLELSLHTFKMKDRKVKQSLSRAGYQWEVKGIRKG